MIDRAEALKRAMDIGTSGILGGSFSERVAFRKAIADAIEQAVRETAEECAGMADAATGPFPGVGRLLPCAEIAHKIRAVFGIEVRP